MAVPPSYSLPARILPHSLSLSIHPSVSVCLSLSLFLSLSPLHSCVLASLSVLLQAHTITKYNMYIFSERDSRRGKRDGNYGRVGQRQDHSSPGLKEKKINEIIAFHDLSDFFLHSQPPDTCRPALTDFGRGYAEWCQDSGLLEALHR